LSFGSTAGLTYMHSARKPGPEAGIEAGSLRILPMKTPAARMHERRGKCLLIRSIEGNLLSAASP
ncbi:unnamed protein product, partial [marine sediment metagenome]